MLCLIEQIFKLTFHGDINKPHIKWNRKLVTIFNINFILEHTPQWVDTPLLRSTRRFLMTFASPGVISVRRRNFSGPHCNRNHLGFFKIALSSAFWSVFNIHTHCWIALYRYNMRARRSASSLPLPPSHQFRSCCWNLILQVVAGRSKAGGCVPCPYGTSLVTSALPKFIAGDVATYGSLDRTPHCMQIRRRWSQQVTSNGTRPSRANLDEQKTGRQ